MSESTQFIGEVLHEQLELMVGQKKKFLTRFKGYQKTETQIAALSSIPGIAEVRACIIAAVVLSPKRFPNKHKFWAYSCLVKHDSRSGGVSYGKKNVPGNRILKSVFMGAAKTVLAGDGEFRKLYDTFREEGVDHAAATKNVARKIAAIALASMRKGTHYKENYEINRKPKIVEINLKHSAARI